MRVESLLEIDGATDIEFSAFQCGLIDSRLLAGPLEWTVCLLPAVARGRGGSGRLWLEDFGVVGCHVVLHVFGAAVG